MKFEVYKYRGYLYNNTIELSIKIYLFHWCWVFKNSEWKLIIDAWFVKFKVSIYINNFLLFNLVNF